MGLITVAGLGLGGGIVVSGQLIRLEKQFKGDEARDDVGHGGLSFDELDVLEYLIVVFLGEALANTNDKG